MRSRNIIYSHKDYYLIMEDGGGGLFDFVFKAHQLIKTGDIQISEWHKVVKIMFKQMIDCIQYIHCKNVCHFDISLENFLINDVPVSIKRCSNGNEVIVFDTDQIHVKLCDFGYDIFLTIISLQNASLTFFFVR